ncbi:ABC transporter substrate-binding protein [Egicoccus sp. AB-alg2]|uniref:peptide ABC transporter substrate-binding protein n=1 Tax=Egicoccus sp. AB-alg2 TaxID=3242693 RepID=UPI00359D4B59
MPAARSVAWLALAAMLVAACTGRPATGPAQAPSPATAPAPPAAASGVGGTLRIALTVDPASIDPRFVADDEGDLVVGALFDPLVRLDDALAVVPAAAERWEVDEDGRRFVFHLREARFHDGTPVTAQDFERSFTRLLDGTARPPSYLGHLLEPVVGADQVQQQGGAVPGLRAVDESTLEIRLSSPQPGFLRTLADPSLVPLPEVADRDPDGFAARPVGNGPFAMTEPREPGQFLRLTRNADHHRPPLLDEVVLSVYPDDTTRDAQWDDLLEGQLHVAEVPTDRLDEARETFGASPDGYSGPGLLDGITATTYLYGFDVDQPPFDDLRVRRALSLAIDRTELANEVLAGARVPAFGIVPPPVPGSQARACGDCRHDPDEARALWAEVVAERSPGSPPADEAADAATDEAADGPSEGSEAPEDGAGDAQSGTDAEPRPAGDGTAGAAADDAAGEVADDAAASAQDEEPPLPEDLARITLTHNRGRTHSAIAERMAADIEATLGIAVDLQALDLPAFVERVRDGEAGLFRVGWDTNEPDPGAYLVPLFHGAETGRDNLTGYRDGEVDTLLEEARAEADPAAARALWREAEQRILDDLPVMPLLWYRQSRAVAPEVEGLRWDAFGRVDLARVGLASD